MSVFGNKSFTSSPELNRDVILRVIPRGGIILWWGTTAPEGFLLCNGGVYSAVDYIKLSNAIGNTTATLTLPNIAAPVAGTAYVIKY